MVKNALIIRKQPECHIVYFDNFFNYDLLVDLHKQDFKATGMMRNNCSMNRPLIDVNAMKKRRV